MALILVAVSSLVAAGLAFFSGFGLGTLLLPVFALFFPVEAAIAVTAVVHFLNNLFKLYLMRQHIDQATVVRFGVPALAGAGVGAWLLLHLAGLPPILTYAVGGTEHLITPVKLAVACLMAGFAWYESRPAAEAAAASGAPVLVFGGLLTGFFGGVSGHQGALRSAFLTRLGLPKEDFIGTGVAIACVVDITRLAVYSGHMAAVDQEAARGLLLTAVCSALVGTWVARRFLHAVTMRIIQNLVIVGLLLIALGLGSGLL